MFSNESCIVETRITDNNLIVVCNNPGMAGELAARLTHSGYNFAVKNEVQEDATTEITFSTERQAAPIFHNA